MTNIFICLSNFINLIHTLNSSGLFFSRFSFVLFLFWSFIILLGFTILFIYIHSSSRNFSILSNLFCYRLMSCLFFYSLFLPFYWCLPFPFLEIFDETSWETCIYTLGSILPTKRFLDIRRFWLESSLVFKVCWL